jgi:hypothetical protein
LAAAFLAVFFAAFLAPDFFAGAFLAPPPFDDFRAVFFAGPLARRSASSSAAR